MTHAPVTLILVHDAELVVEGVRAMVGRYPSRMVVIGAQLGGEAPTDVEVPADLALVGALGPTGAVARRIRAFVNAGVAASVVAYSWALAQVDATVLLAAGASGVLSMAASGPVLVADLERVHCGERVVRGVATAETRRRSTAGRLGELSARELELLALIADGLSNAEIGQELFLAQSTVKTYLKRLYRKLEVSSRTQAVIRAVEMGLIGNGRWLVDAVAEPSTTELLDPS